MLRTTGEPVCQNKAIPPTKDPIRIGSPPHTGASSATPSNRTVASAALEKICQCYWPPLYSYIRRQGYTPEEAEDLTQSFFAGLLQKNFWARADPQKGRFRSFLLTALRHFLADERDRVRTVKRGGGVTVISFDEEIGEGAFLESLGQNLSSEQQFERQWAATVLEQARGKLRLECVAAGKADLFDRVSLFDGRYDRSVPYTTIAQELGMTVSALKSAISRLRARYGELVRDEVALTVSDRAELPGEIRYLLSILGY